MGQKNRTNVHVSLFLTHLPKSSSDWLTTPPAHAHFLFFASANQVRILRPRAPGECARVCSMLCKRKCCDERIHLEPFPFPDNSALSSARSDKQSSASVVIFSCLESFFNFLIQKSIQIKRIGRCCLSSTIRNSALVVPEQDSIIGATVSSIPVQEQPK